VAASRHTSKRAADSNGPKLNEGHLRIRLAAVSTVRAIGFYGGCAIAALLVAGLLRMHVMASTGLCWVWIMVPIHGGVECIGQPVYGWTGFPFQAHRCMLEGSGEGAYPYCSDSGMGELSILANWLTWTALFALGAKAARGAAMWRNRDVLRDQG
jgi:hypothetical protein